ncbi:unnamed protein product [Cuscuta epithymum]|uniref:Uncharacterized protein n=1 Tax=Cuscuta epithymum TaxID=186058 RepID=A0AAV0DX66_9ASTE|nr:unnamed protein product [Cuscuta epithymum]
MRSLLENNLIKFKEWGQKGGKDEETGKKEEKEKEMEKWERKKKEGSEGRKTGKKDEERSLIHSFEYRASHKPLRRLQNLQLKMELIRRKCKVMSHRLDDGER